MKLYEEILENLVEQGFEQFSETGLEISKMSSERFGEICKGVLLFEMDYYLIIDDLVYNMISSCSEADVLKLLSELNECSELVLEFGNGCEQIIEDDLFVLFVVSVRNGVYNKFRGI